MYTPEHLYQDVKTKQDNVGKVLEGDKGRQRICQLAWKPPDYGVGNKGVKELIRSVQASQKNYSVYMAKKKK